MKHFAARLALLIAVFLVLLPMGAQARVLDIETFKTPKGIDVWMVEDHTLPVVAVSFAFRAGSATAPAALQGVTRMLSNTLDEGAGDIGAREFQERLRDAAIDFSYGATRDEFSGSMRTLVRHKDEALKLMQLSLNKPRFDAEAVERMRAANLSSVRSSLGDAGWINTRLLYDAIYKGHPYALNAGGTLESLGRITAADIRAERKRIFARSRLVVGVAGDMGRQDVAAMVDAAFGDLPESGAEAALAQAAMPVAGKPVFYAKAMPQTILSMAWEGIGIHDPDYYAAVVMDYIFGGGSFSSRLMAEVREKAGLTYGISSDLMQADYGDRYIVNASMQPQNVRKTIETVEAVARQMRERDVSAEELSGAREYLVGVLPLRFSSTQRIADTLVGLQLAKRPPTAFDDYREKISAVTAADIRRVANRVFAAKPVVVLVGAAPEGVDYTTVTTIPNAEKPTTK